MTDIYRRLTTTGTIYLKDGDIVVKDMDAVLAFIDTMPEDMPERQQIVFFALAMQEKARLTAFQAMRLWEEIDIAASARRRAGLQEAFRELVPD